MKIAYGPPGLTGVKQLQYVGADDADYVSSGLHALVQPLGYLALGVAIYGGFAGNKRLQVHGGAVAAAAFLVDMLSKK